MLLLQADTGYFRVKVVFSEAVFENADQTDVAIATVENTDLGTVTLGDGENDAWSYIAGSVGRGDTDYSGISVSAIERVNTAAAGAAAVLSKTQFMVTLQLL